MRFADENEADTEGVMKETLAPAVMDACADTPAETLTATGGAGADVLVSRGDELDKTKEGRSGGSICLLSRSVGDDTGSCVGRPTGVLEKSDATRPAKADTDGESTQLSTTPSPLAAQAMTPSPAKGVFKRHFWKALSLEPVNAPPQLP